MTSVIVPFKGPTLCANSFIRALCSSRDNKSRISRIFSYASIPDTGGETDNPHHLVERLINRGGPYTVSDLNSVLSKSGVGEMSTYDFDRLTSLAGIEFSLPLSTSARIKALGSVNTAVPTKGIYIFTARNGDSRVGSAINLPKRLAEHSGSGSKSSSELRRMFTLFGEANITLTVYVVPADTTYDALLGLEQYFMIKLNPAYCSLKVVNNPTSSRGSTFKAYNMTGEELEAIRVKTGQAGFVYNREGDLLYTYLSLQQLMGMFATRHAGHNAIQRFLDTGQYYKGVVLISSTPINTATIPTMSEDQFRAYLQGVFDTPYDYTNRAQDPKSNAVLISGTSPTGDFITVECTSARNASDKMRLTHNITINRSRVNKLVIASKARGAPVPFTADGYTLTLSAIT